MKREPHIVTISGPSLSGKTELSKVMKERYGFNHVVSCTSRPKREGEVEGVDYYYKDADFFKEGIKNDLFIQTTEYNGYYYGVLKSTLRIDNDKPLLWVIAPQSIGAVKNYCDNNDIKFTSVFIDNAEELLLGRLFKRFRDDLLADVKTYVKRLEDMLSVEKLWKDAFNYDIVVSGFDDINKDLVVEELASRLAYSDYSMITVNKLVFKPDMVGLNQVINNINYSAYDLLLLGYELVIPSVKSGLENRILIYSCGVIDGYEGELNYQGASMFGGGNVDGMSLAYLQVNRSEVGNDSDVVSLRVLDSEEVSASRVRLGGFANAGWSDIGDKLMLEVDNDIRDLASFLLDNNIKDGEGYLEELKRTLLVLISRDLGSSFDKIPKEDLANVERVFLGRSVNEAGFTKRKLKM